MSAPRTERSPLGAFSPTHAAPAGGMPAWETPDSAGTTAATLDADVRFRVTERRGDWARIVCSNGWSAWVDGRREFLAVTADQRGSRGYRPECGVGRHHPCASVLSRHHWPEPAAWVASSRSPQQYR